MNAARHGSSGRVVVILPPDAAQDVAAPLVEAAAALAAGEGASLDVIEGVDSAGAAAARPAAAVLPTPTRWWRSEPGFPARLDSAALVAWAEAALSRVVGDAPALVLWPSGVQAHEEAAARLAGRAGVPSLGRVAELARVDGILQARRPSWGGRALLALECASPGCVACWRPAGPSGDAGDVAPSRHAPEHLALEVSPGWPATGPAQAEPSADRLRALEGAALVLAGGRGLGAEGFAVLGSLAERLDAALAGSLPSVDAGWVPVARQVGQSGKFVAPRAYLAVGISGTPQHLAGVAAGSRILAVNSDPEAPIFAVASVGVVADWREFLPALQQALGEAT